MPRFFKISIYVLACVAVFLCIDSISKKYDPVRRANAFEWEKEVDIYFINSYSLEDDKCRAEVSVKRMVNNAETLGPGALLALMAGPKESESASGLLSFINKDALLQKFELKSGVASVDFNEVILKEIKDPCATSALISQIENTLLPLPDIDSVVISVDGKKKDF